MESHTTTTIYNLIAVFRLVLFCATTFIRPFESHMCETHTRRKANIFSIESQMTVDAQNLELEM